MFGRMCNPSGDILMTVLTKRQAHKAKQNIPTEWELIGQLIETIINQSK